MKKDILKKFNEISADDVRKAITRINQGAVGETNQSNSEIIAARSIIDEYLLSYGDIEERRKQTAIIDAALGITEYGGSTTFNFTDGTVGNGSNKTSKIAVSSLGTGLPEQVKTPRSTRNKTFIAPNED